MRELDPYAPPKADIDPGVRAEHFTLSRVADTLVTPLRVELPDRCVKCNGDTQGYRLTKTLYWHPPLFYLFLLLNALIYVIAAALARKKAIVSFGLCPEHRDQRRNAIQLAWLLVVGSLVIVALAIRADINEAAVFALLPFGILSAAVVGITRGSVLRPERINKDHAVLKGAGPRFLDSIQEGSQKLDART
jgi:hypothetical protein